MRRKPSERVAAPGSLTLGDFWSWAYSDLMCNTTRSIFAEFLVAAALDLLDQPRVEWDAADLRYKGRGIEVKAAAYLQSWQQDKLSDIKYDIAKKQAWEAATNSYSSEPLRSADCYVFCLYPVKEPERADILQTDDWEFYVVSKERIEAVFGEQKTVGLKGVRALVAAVGYADLKKEIDAALALEG